MDAAHRPLGARWWWEPNRKAAIIESAMVIGLAQLPSKRFHPFDLDTYGLGKVIGAAHARGPSDASSASVEAPPTTEASVWLWPWAGNF